MADFNGFDSFSEDLARGIHDLETHDCKVYLSNTQPVVTMEVKANLAEFGGGSGYTAGGEDMGANISRDGPLTTVNVTNVSWTATGPDWTPFQHVVAYNDTPTTPKVDPLVNWWTRDEGPLTLNNGETFTVDFTGNQWLTIQ